MELRAAPMVSEDEVFGRSSRRLARFGFAGWRQWRSGEVTAHRSFVEAAMAVG